MKRVWCSIVVLAAFAVPASAGTMTSGTADALRGSRKPTCAKADPVVWVNASATIYFPEGSRWYGKTRGGTWNCRSDAVRGGAQPAKSSAPAAADAEPASAPATPASPVPASSP